MVGKKKNEKNCCTDRNKPVAGGYMQLQLNGLVLMCLILLCGITAAAVPKADFTCSQVAADPLKISCTDQSTGSPSGWAWFFGDEKYDQPWVQMNESTPWSARRAQSSVALSDGSIVMMGGSFTNIDQNGKEFIDGVYDVWRSEDNGIHWVMMNESAVGYRLSHSAVALPNDVILLIGGYGMNDTWGSADKGMTWYKVTKEQFAEWPGRHDFSAVSLSNGHVVIFGGQNASGEVLNDTWQSVDYGATFTNVTGLPGWLKRGMLSGVALPDDKIILMGGLGGLGYSNDVWMSVDEGATWTEIKKNTPHVDWEVRRYHSTVAMPDGSIILMGGSYIEGDPPFNDMWRSTDNGATWSLVNGKPWPVSRASFSSVVEANATIVVIGGNSMPQGDLRDVWSLDPAGSREVDPSHPYAAPGTYKVTLRVYNADGYSTKWKYITLGETQYYINVKPVPEIHVGDKFTINATTNLPIGQEVLVEAYAPYFDRNHKPQSGEFSGVSNMVRVQAGEPNSACSCCKPVNFFLFDIDSSTFKPDVYLINDTAVGIPQLGRSYFYVRGYDTPVTPLALDPVIIVCGIIGACGIIHCIRKPKR
jgi:PKD repeat protein